MKKYYFQIASIFLLLLAIIAFSDNLITHIGQESNKSPMYFTHGLFMFAWFITFVVQTNFIRKGDIKAHMRWGVAGMVIALGVFISTAYVFISIYEGWNVMSPVVKGNRIYMLSFAVLVAFGYLNRQNGTRHKHYIYMASLLILDPILSRVTANLHIQQVDAFIIIVWNGLFISLMIYDWLTLKKIHRIAWMGYLWYYVVLVATTII